MRRAIALAVLGLIASGLAAPAQQRPQTPRSPQTQPEPAPEPPLVYEPQLLQLAEALGLIAYLAPLCGEGTPDAWRRQAEELLEAEARTPALRARLAGAYNRGFIGHQPLHRVCRERTREALAEAIAEARRLARDIAGRFGG